MAGLIRWSLEAATRGRTKNGGPNARFLVLDPNGEYRNTLGGLGEVRHFEVTPREGSDGEPLQVPAWMWNSHEWAAFAQAAPGTQRPLLMQGLRNLRAGEALQVSPDVRLARLLRGYRNGLAEKLSQGPAGYSGAFPTRKSCGQLLVNLACSCRLHVRQSKRRVSLRPV